MVSLISNILLKRNHMPSSRRNFLKWILPSSAIAILSGGRAIGSTEKKDDKMTINTEKNACISFVFDDAKATQYSVVAPFFKAKGLTCGFAISTGSLNTPSNMLGSDVIELANNGFEIINHAFSGVPFNSGVNDTFARAELETAQSMLLGMGINPTMMQTPSSLAPSELHPVIKSMFEFAFTQQSRSDPMSGENPTELWRYGIELTSTEVIPLSEAKHAIDAAKQSQGVIIFYAHDVPAGGNKIQLISDIIDYAMSVGVDVVSPYDAATAASSHKNAPSRSYVKGETIINGTDGWSASNGSVSVQSNGDVVITSSAAGECLIQRSTPLSLENGEAINFSSAIRKLTGTIKSCSIGLNTFNGNSRIKTLELPIIGLDAEYRRYSATQQIGPVVNRLLQYVRVTFSAAGERVMLYAPTVRYGTNVSPDANWKVLKPVGITAGQVIPNLSSAYTEIKLVHESNELFTTSGSEIIFSRPCKVMFSVSIISNGPSLSSSTGGLLRINFGDQSIDIPSTGTKIAGASHSMTMYFDARASLSFSMLSTGSSFSIHPSSSIFIQEQ